jgi:hypothetical protein
MMRRLVLLACASLTIGALETIVLADEGMWLFNHPPTEKITARYNFTLTPAWLDHLQKSSVRFNSGGSGSFVSADGLTFTNHHIAQTCLHGLSTAARDLYKTGFYAKTWRDEAKCPDLELNVLMSADDVTGEVNAGINPATAAAEAGAKQRANMSQVESDCNKSTGLRCDVITLYSGAVYQLYRYKKYTDVRLVFAPEFDIAFFGGDPDNFEFPRYDLDIAFFRIYENGSPVHLDHYLKWGTGDLKDGDLVFVSGHPGSTDRLATMSQLGFLRDLSLPLSLETGRRRTDVLKKWGARSPENYRRAQQTIFSLENNLKRNKVYLSSLFDQTIMDRKQTEENGLKQSPVSDSRKAEDGDPWADIAQAVRIEREIYLPFLMIERRSGFAGDLASYARTLVRVVADKQKPNSARLREYNDAALPSLEQSLFASDPVYKDMEAVLLADSLAMLQEKLPNDPTTGAVLEGRAPADVARDLVAGTRLDNPAVRKQLYDGGEAAIRNSADPMIVLMRSIDAEARTYRTRYDDQVASVERIAGGRIGRRRFDRDGFGVAPDATFTLRLSYGRASGYVEDGIGDAVPKGTKVDPFTSIGGAFDRATKMGSRDPFRLPKSWLDARKAGKLNLATPFNFVSTADIIGGNSGSPVVNKAAEVVGIIFDGNMQSLPWRYVFDDAIGRAVSVDSRGILEALRNVYGASRLAAELAGTSPRDN